MNIDNVVMSQFPADLRSFNSDAGEKHRAALKLQKDLQKRDRRKIRVPHPTLPNTWLLVTKKRARELGCKI